MKGSLGPVIVPALPQPLDHLLLTRIPRNQDLVYPRNLHPILMRISLHRSRNPRLSPSPNQHQARDQNPGLGQSLLRDLIRGLENRDPAPGQSQNRRLDQDQGRLQGPDHPRDLDQVRRQVLDRDLGHRQIRDPDLPRVWGRDHPLDRDQDLPLNHSQDLDQDHCPSQDQDQNQLQGRDPYLFLAPVHSHSLDQARYPCRDQGQCRFLDRVPYHSRARAQLHSRAPVQLPSLDQVQPHFLVQDRHHFRDQDHSWDQQDQDRLMPQYRIQILEPDPMTPDQNQGQGRTPTRNQNPVQDQTGLMTETQKTRVRRGPLVRALTLRIWERKGRRVEISKGSGQ